MRKIVSITVLLAAVAGLVVLNRMRKSTNAKYTIGILQTASHISLDAACQGFMQELSSKLGKDVAFVIKNAQGNISQAHALAQQFHNDSSITGILAIATPALQAMHAVEKEKPVFMSAVTYPEGLGVVYPATNVCGVNDKITIKDEVAMVIAFVPTAKTVALLYTSGEMNSARMAQEMRKELELRGLSVTDFAVSNESDIQVMTELACRKSDVLLTPTDNTVGSAVALVASLALKYKKPLFVSANMQVKEGALASRGVDYFESGKRTAQIAYSVLVEGKSPADCGIEQSESANIAVNKNSLSTLEMSVPKDLEKFIVFM